MRKAALILSFAALALLQSCGGSLDFLGLVWTLSDTADERFEQSQEYNAKRGPVTVSVPSDDYKFYVFTDQHTDETTVNLDKFVNNYLNDTEAAPFCLCLGDVVDGKDVYSLFLDHIAPITENPSIYYFPALGNHDIYYGQWDEWKSKFNTSSYYFEVALPSGAKDFFLCMDTASGTLGRKQIAWVRETLEKAATKGYRHTIVYTHTNIYKKDGSQGHTSNMELEETYELIKMFSENGVNLVLMGHDHSREYTMFNGISYVIIDSLEDTSVCPCYGIVYLGDDDIDLEFVPVGSVAQ